MSTSHLRSYFCKMPAETEETILGCLQWLIDADRVSRSGVSRALLASIVISASLLISTKRRLSNRESHSVEIVLARRRFIPISVIAIQGCLPPALFLCRGTPSVMSNPCLHLDLLQLISKQQCKQHHTINLPTRLVLQRIPQLMRLRVHVPDHVQAETGQLEREIVEVQVRVSEIRLIQSTSLEGEGISV